MRLLVQEADLAKVGEILAAEWRENLVREGLPPTPAPAVSADESADGEPPCPACGHAAPLVDGACAECGLQLA